MAVIMGTRRMREAVVSTKVPAANSTTLISKSRSTGLSVIPRRPPANAAGISSMAAIQENIEAMEMMNMTTEAVIPAWPNMGAISLILIFL